MNGRTLAHYEIIEKLGEGGMGVVYKARDTHLNRLVAIKVLPPDKTADAERRQRFVREARAASALNHANIVTVHDISQEDGADFMVMEYAAGQTLGLRIARGLGVREAVRYGIQMADALAAAHAAGIVHRDLKPANIIITDVEQVKVLDFGLAKLAERALTEEEATRTAAAATVAGVVVGTCGYMAPEQAQGQAVDGRADLFSLGAVLYQMLSGRRAFAGATELATLTAVLHDEPAPLGACVPEALQRIVARCLRKSASERYQGAAEVKQALEKVAAALEEAGGPPSIAVLPFANLSADKENEYFSDGLAEDIIDALAHVPGLRVTARTSAFVFRGGQHDIREIGARLNVEHVVEGSVRKAGNRVRVTAQLIKVSDGYHLWSERFDRDLTDIFAIQDEISQAIVGQLRAQLLPGGPLMKRSTANVEAYSLFLRGRHCIYQSTPESLERGREAMEQALALDPGFAEAHHGLAMHQGLRAFFGYAAPRDALAKVRACAEQALRLDGRQAEARGDLAICMAVMDFDWAGAEREFRRALQSNPAAVDARIAYAVYVLMATGRLDEALAEVQHAVEIDPLSPVANCWLGVLLYRRREYGLAIAQLRRLLELYPDYFPALLVLAVTYGLSGNIEEAIATARRGCEVTARAPLSLGTLARGLAYAGRTEEVQPLLEELIELGRTRYVPSLALVMAYRGVGNQVEANRCLEQAIEERDLFLVSGLRTEPVYDPLRPLPIYREWMRRMKLEE